MFSKSFKLLSIATYIAENVDLVRIANDAGYRAMLVRMFLEEDSSIGGNSMDGLSAAA